ncbi:MAG TPA: tRNA lysidine(34) synthetase TilS [Candidatus Sulfotelmatobacter sp.]
MHSLDQRVLSHIRRQELLQPGDRVGIAVSGGIDSVALLRLLLELRGELGVVVSVVHFNHKLRGAESDADQEFVAGLAREHGLEFLADGDDAALLAAEEHISLETAARELRYGFFRCLLGAEEDVGPPAAEAAVHRLESNRTGAAPPNSGPQGLKPHSKEMHLRGAEASLFHGTAEAVPFPNPPVADEIPAAFLNVICTGHTLDDQAETVLMRVIRGTGLRGLGAIYPRIAVEDDEGEVCGEIIRPLLGIRRRQLEQYLHDIGQSWREDSSNADDAFTRNRVRQMVVPLLEEKFNRAVSENLAELAEIARGEEDYWENEVAGWMGTVVQWAEPEWRRGLAAGGDSLVQIQRAASEGSEGSAVETETVEGVAMDASVDRRWLLGEPIAVQRRLVKAVGERAEIPLEFKHVEDILQFAAESGTAGKKLTLPLGWSALVEPEALIFLAPDPRREKIIPHDYEYELELPGRVSVPEIGSVIEALRVTADEAGYNPEHLLDGVLLRGPLRVRNWRAGDRFWPAHSKAPKKIKELLQDRHVAQPERRLWPVVLMGKEGGDQIVWVRGFAVPARLRVKAEQAGVLIREMAPSGNGTI